MPGLSQGTGEHAGGQSLVKHPAGLWWGRRMEGAIEKEWEALGFTGDLTSCLKYKQRKI